MMMMMNLQMMVKKLTDSGWKKVDTEEVKEEDIRALFDMIDKDRSGSLSLRVMMILQILEIYDCVVRKPRELLN